MISRSLDEMKLITCAGTERLTSISMAFVPHCILRGQLS
jgi:hypothetical protein